MARGQIRRRCTCLLPLSGWLVACALHAQSAPTQSDWGGAGLLQTPTARMADEGELAFTASRVAPYTRYNVTLQPLPWLEGIIRYSVIGNRLYGPQSLSGNQSYKDKSIDVKARLLDESRYVPTLAIGIRDIGGTGLFSGEYVVLNKRMGPLDASLGLAWGYLGSRGDISNPLDIFSSRFSTRPGRDANPGGQFNGNDYFRGPTALFGGVSYQTFLEPLLVKLEYDGNNYRHEPLGDNQKQSTPFNIGVVYRLNKNIDLSLALERGTTGMLGLTLHTNLADRGSPTKTLDPLPYDRPAVSTVQSPEKVNWTEVSSILRDNAGIEVSKISRRGSELLVTGEQQRYFYTAKGVGRTARILDAQVDPSIDWYTVVATKDGMPIVSTSLHRGPFDDLIENNIDLSTFRRSVEQDAPLSQREKVLYEAPLNKYDGGLSLTYGQSVGGPNSFILYQVAADYDANYHFTPGLWLSGIINANLINNYGGFTHDSPSELPRVRTYIREYLTSSRITMPDFQLTTARVLGDDLYGMAYAGMLESMFGGVGGEVLYRPLGEQWALGANLNWVKQRGFDQDFSFRHYQVVTGLMTGYFDTGYKNVTLALSAGRYLAGDWGGTIDISRQFHNGVKMGVYATFTNVSSQQFGEGSFDKGIYVSIPFDLLLSSSHVDTASFLYQPLLRDGGARLNRRYALYDLTDGRDEEIFQDNLQQITH